MHWTKLSPKQKRIFTWWTSDRYDTIICDGSIRSGKTLCMSASFIIWAMSRFDGEQFALCGKTIESLRRNVTNALPQILEGIYTVKEKRSENLIEITHGTRKNRFYLFGGKDERAQDLIQGITLAGVLFDEVALMPESFVNQATARCSIEGSKFWFNCNPAGPHHWFREKWLLNLAAHKALHLHFTLEDNLSLGESIKARYRSMYSGVFYDRYIRGLWTLAEGVIYSMFSPGRHVFTDMPDTGECTYLLSCDYGTLNPFALGLFAKVRRDGKVAYMLMRELYHDGRRDGQKTDGEYADMLESFVQDIGRQTIIVDPSAASFIAELRRRGWKVQKANNNVLDGIRYVSALLNESRLLIHSSCKATLGEFSEYVWDERAARSGEDRPLKENDHAMDMIRYALYTDRHAMDERRPVIRRGAL